MAAPAVADVRQVTGAVPDPGQAPAYMLSVCRAGFGCAHLGSHSCSCVRTCHLTCSLCFSCVHRLLTSSLDAIMAA